MIISDFKEGKKSCDKVLAQQREAGKKKAECEVCKCMIKSARKAKHEETLKHLRNLKAREEELHPVKTIECAICTKHIREDFYKSHLNSLMHRQMKN